MTVDELKRIYLTEDTPVMSELARQYADELTVEEIRELLTWSGDDYWMTVNDDKEIEPMEVSMEEAEKIIEEKYMHKTSCPSTFASAYLDSEDIFCMFNEYAKNRTGEQLVKVFQRFFDNDKLREEIETAMIEAAEEIVKREIGKVDIGE